MTFNRVHFYGDLQTMPRCPLFVYFLHFDVYTL